MEIFMSLHTLNWLVSRGLDGIKGPLANLFNSSIQSGMFQLVGKKQTFDSV